MLGQPMRVKVNDSLTIKLGPFNKNDVHMLIKDGGIGLHSISRHLTSSFRALTIEDEEEWYDKVRQREDSWVWGIWDASDKEAKLIGTTSLNSLENHPIRQVSSGSVIVDSAYWGKGIASAIHKARTWYAFNQLNLMRIKSAVALPNIGSKKALSRSGYFYHSTERNVQFVDGKYEHHENLECLNPADLAWSTWWHEDTPTREAIAARKVTLEALKWASENVELL